MSLHLCPIEPDDWSNGPNDPEDVECESCVGSGWVDEDNPNSASCPDCKGTGFKEYEPYEPDFDELGWPQ